MPHWLLQEGKKGEKGDLSHKKVPTSINVKSIAKPRAPLKTVWRLKKGKDMGEIRKKKK